MNNFNYCQYHKHQQQQQITTFDMSKNNSTQPIPTSQEAESMPMKVGEKTIPFLRRLIDMLQENATVIEFCPGNRTESIAGRIVVHDRAYVELEILPRYFNHSSFASLRRQLNYFAFSREGKGKQKGATYSNDLVFDMQDILHLKRRLPGAGVTGTAPLNPNPSVQNAVVVPVTLKQVQVPTETIKSISDATTTTATATAITTKSLKKDSRSKSRRSAKHKKKNKKVQRILDCVVPCVHITSKRKSSIPHHDSSTDTVDVDVEMRPKAPSSTAVSPPPAEITTSKVKSASQIVLDLTKPLTTEFGESSSQSHQSLAGSKHNISSISSIRSSWNYQPIAISRNVSFQLPHYDLGMITTGFKTATADDTKKEADVLAGCNALLSLGWRTPQTSG